ncbi:BQ5605_C013g07221 [Microbotryum silenes-dioicae]|uniref:BQ5605_C013g07221 protein n=1 Tax=Microbotryum silenes-dioicae TaxID=796604 RepID=A0A2X0LVE7_9BASI|nr:BQ5605_C013g07221 [Microbotryum silenes-dioicae]
MQWRVGLEARAIRVHESCRRIAGIGDGHAGSLEKRDQRYQRRPELQLILPQEHRLPSHISEGAHCPSFTFTPNSSHAKQHQGGGETQPLVATGDLNVLKELKRRRKCSTPTHVLAKGSASDPRSAVPMVQLEM